MFSVRHKSHLRRFRSFKPDEADIKGSESNMEVFVGD